MTPVVAALIIVAMVAALSVLGPQTQAHRPAHLRVPEPRPVASGGSGIVAAARASLRSRHWVRLSMSTASAALLLVAVVTIGWPFYTNLLQERLQSRLDRELQSTAVRTAYVQRTVEVGSSLTRILIPDIRVDVVVVEGTTETALRAGAGHYADTPLPCEVGNVAIAGHRTTYGRPFHNLDQLHTGSEITLQTPIGSCTYRVTKSPFVVSPKALEVLANTPDEATLTLTTCHPKGSARQRLIVRATLVRSDSTRSS